MKKREKTEAKPFERKRKKQKKNERTHFEKEEGEMKGVCFIERITSERC